MKPRDSVAHDCKVVVLKTLCIFFLEHHILEGVWARSAQIRVYFPMTLLEPQIFVFPVFVTND